jgi:hypothetical protein
LQVQIKLQDPLPEETEAHRQSIARRNPEAGKIMLAILGEAEDEGL